MAYENKGSSGPRRFFHYAMVITHSIYVIHCLYIRSLSVMLSRISFHVLYGRESCPRHILFRRRIDLSRRMRDSTYDLLSSGISSLQQGELSTLVVGTSSGSRNSSLTVGMPCNEGEQLLDTYLRYLQVINDLKKCGYKKDNSWMESSSDSDQEINANMVFMAQIEKVLSESDESSSSVEETIAEVAYYTSESERESEFETSEYYDNSTNYGLFVNNDDDQEIFHDAIESASENLLKWNKNVKRYSRKDLSSCNNSHQGETSSASVCNDAMNVSCNSRMCDLSDDNNFFIFDDESVRISSVSKMPFRKKPRDSMNIIQICLWMIDSRCLKHMTGNRALLTNFMEKFLGTVRFGNNDFAVIIGYEDVVIGSMTIKKVYYVEVLGHNLFSIGQFCDKGLEVAFQRSTCFVRNEDGVDLLTGDRSSNL
uniref:Integrase, catalytic region, zinc finger, CCHC-type, peptidase aspartic, catalytic n=1 Tax=Tanacetum cinerariifolium TaxID=118510 RepID=A0A6L2M599_TANCI|nr:integrase, catalytic region, zinc finger, CCHC-type, peptidase aspartic, catalytic [Tanacetum cinerariifolium]